MTHKLVMVGITLDCKLHYTSNSTLSHHPGTIIYWLMHWLWRKLDKITWHTTSFCVFRKTVKRWNCWLVLNRRLDTLINWYSTYWLSDNLTHGMLCCPYTECRAYFRNNILLLHNTHHACHYYWLLYWCKLW